MHLSEHAYSVVDQFHDNKKQVFSLLSSIQPVLGRFNMVRSEEFVGIVDYAHSPDALRKVIMSISKFCNIQEDLIIVIGCGGDRDQGKRSIMGKIAVENSHLSVFTADNPRSENPNKIIQDMLSDLSLEQQKKVQQIPDRQVAISTAVQLASNSTVILIAGKGHECFQEINGSKIPFDDLAILKQLLNK